MNRKSQDHRSTTVSPQESEPKEPTMEAARDAPKGNGSAVLPASSLECPAELPPIARQEWDRIVGELIVRGVLSKFDRGPLAIYCGAYAMWVDAMEGIQQYGTMMKSPNGFPVQSPYVAIVNRQAEIMMRIAGEFGFTPAARSRSFSYSKSESMLLEASTEAKDDSMKW